MSPAPTLLLILDGWGLAPAGPGNAVSLANMPNLRRLGETYPSTTLACSGRDVGLPAGFMGNSEVGHMNIGAGRIVYQDMTRIDIAIEDGTFFKNQPLLDLMRQVKASGGRLHFMGLLSDGGVHSHINHLRALVEMARDAGVEDVLVHAFMDGRDTPPSSGEGFVADLERTLAEIGKGRIATVTGRYWAMDRDKRWERVEQAWKALVLGEGLLEDSALEAVRSAYAAGETDEFIKPRTIKSATPSRIQDGDGLFFFNFRADRAREISRAFFEDDFPGFARSVRPKLAGFASMTMYESTFPLPAAFPPQSVRRGLGEIVSEMGLKQLRLAETEKYAHVTYFFSCGREEPFPGEDRVLVPSPRDVATYDLKPEMSAPEVCKSFLDKWSGGDYALAVVNLANLDMVGHTGIVEAAVRACEVVDECVGRMVQAVLDVGGRVLVTADHGNAEEMIAESGGAQTAHSKNRVPFVLADDARKGAKLREGRLGDIAPTILDLWDAAKPGEMTGQSLVEKE